MSRLGKKNIEVPEGVDININSQGIKIKGKKGELFQSISDDIEIVHDAEGKTLTCVAKEDLAQTRANHGLYRSLIFNMITGVSKGFEKQLLLEGVGYRVSAQKNKLTFSLGFCHPIEFWVEPQVVITLDGNTKIKLECHDKQLLGQVAADIRSLRKPEPYKGKGIRYHDEVIRKKEGKAAGK